MSNIWKVLIVVVLIVAATTIVLVKEAGNSKDENQEDKQNLKNAAIEENLKSGRDPGTDSQKKLPRLLDLGADKCIPCKMMKPILDELKQHYKKQFKVTFIDVWVNQQQAKKYNIKMIPTQIFFDSNGNELFRHEGFYSKEDILSKWEELGINLQK